MTSSQRSNTDYERDAYAGHIKYKDNIISSAKKKKNHIIMRTTT